MSKTFHYDDTLGFQRRTLRYGNAPTIIESTIGQLNSDPAVNEANANTSNADRIRAMSDEELAEFITPVKCVDCRLLDCGVEEEMLNGKRRTCQERVLDWLKQEVKDD